MQVLILCGGSGTRAYPFTAYLPKPMLPINGSPMLLHLMRLFANQGHQDFVLSLGYQKRVIEDYFEGKSLGWNVRLIDTGPETDTAGRIVGCQKSLDETFLVAYADGLADVSFDELIAFHHSHDGLATITGVPLPCQYGTIETDTSHRVRLFREKPIIPQHLINAGFFVFDKKVFDHWHGANLELEVLPALAKEGLVYCYRHEGFFKSLDSYKDQQELERMANAGALPRQIAAQPKR